MNNQAADMNNPSGPSSLKKPDFQAIKSRAIEVIKDPVGVWSKIKSESSSIKDIYQNYAAPLAAIPAISNFIGLTFIGISIPFYGTWRQPFMSGLVSMIVMYVMQLAMLYVGAQVVMKLAPKFGGSVSERDAFAHLAYAMTASYLGGVLGIIPALGLLGALIGLYSLYTYYQGIPTMTGVPDNKRLQFCAAVFVCMIVIGVIVSFVVSAISPGGPSMPL